MYKSIDSSRIRNLKVVSRVRAGQKLNTRYHHYSIEEYGYLSYKSLLRWANGESRDQTVDALTQLVESCVEQHGMKEDEKKRLLFQLNDASVGIKNLSITYKDDSTTCAGLEYILEMIKRFIDDNMELLSPEDREALFLNSEQENEET
jgi:hypothetical protein